MEAIRMLLLAVALVLGGVATTSASTATAGVEDVVTTRVSGSTVGTRRRQLTRRFDALRRRRGRRPAERLRRDRSDTTPGLQVPASVRGPPGR